MALQVWLPLNGSMENQGLLNLTPTQQGTISWIDGKIGKCLSAGNANQTANGISYDSNLVSELGTEFSAAVWVKPLGDHVHYNGTFVSSGNWNGKKWAFGVNQSNSQVDVFCQGYNNFIPCTIPVNTWTHLCCVHQGTTVKLYKNGEYVGEKTDIPEELDSDATNFCVGRETYASGYFSFNGNLNDLRIYNHALSLKEIKELAKGLVLHYKLDDPYIETTTNLNPTVRPAIAANVTWGGHVAQWTNYDATHDPVPFSEGTKCEIVYGENGSTGGGASRSIATIAAEPSTTYTYSCYIKPEDDFAYVTANLIYKYEYNGGTKLTEAGYFNKSRIEPVGDGWYRCWGTFTSRDTTTSINISFYTYPFKTTTYWVGGWQIEKNDHMTPFVEPGTTRTGTVFDCSGYSYNGNIVGTLISNPNTNKYSASTYFESYNDYIYCSLNNNIPDEITMSCWIKSSNKSPHGNYHNPITIHSINFEMSIAGSLGKARMGYVVGGTRYVKDIGPDILDNQWHMLTSTYDGTKICRYIDGELVDSQSVSGALTSLDIIRVGSLNATYGNTQLYESDVRIYATALSAEDVVELYHTAASIDNQGNLFCGEVVE